MCNLICKCSQCYFHHRMILKSDLICGECSPCFRKWETSTVCMLVLYYWKCDGVMHSYISPVLCIKLGWKRVWVDPHTIRWSLKTAADKYLSLFYYFLSCPCVTWSNFSMFPAWYQSYVCVTADHEQFNKLTLYYNEWMMAVTWAAPHKHCVWGHLWMCLCLPCLLLSVSLSVVSGS